MARFRPTTRFMTVPVPTGTPSGPTGCAIHFARTTTFLRADSSSPMWVATTTRPLTRRLISSSAARKLRLARLRVGYLRQPELHLRDLRLPAPRARRLDHGRVRLSRHCVSERLPRAILLCRLHSELD